MCRGSWVSAGVVYSTTLSESLCSTTCTLHDSKPLRTELMELPFSAQNRIHQITTFRLRLVICIYCTVQRAFEARVDGTIASSYHPAEAREQLLPQKAIMQKRSHRTPPSPVFRVVLPLLPTAENCISMCHCSVPSSRYTPSQLTRFLEEGVQLVLHPFLGLVLRRHQLAGLVPLVLLKLFGLQRQGQ